MHKDRSFLADLSHRGHNRSESFSDSEASLDSVLPVGNPIRTNLGLKHEHYLLELIKSPLVERQAEIVENYDIFLNCIYWQVKGQRGRSSIREAAYGIREDYYKWIGRPPPPPSGTGIESSDMQHLDSEGEMNLAAEHDAKFKRYKDTQNNGDSNVIPLPPPNKRLTRRNSAGPFFNRPEMEKMFMCQDINKYYSTGGMIAKGAFGKVFLGVDAHSTQVAIKTTDLKVDASRIHNIAIEIHLLMTCEHPNVVKHVWSFYWDQEIW
eukprot:TRINITY_DN15240_c0_g1_i18.p1 TRINITY_DN15240_c0_g1~~TRINITY_DN15240_c0_g1_i18.p1  ORF type:complete len:298 (-),score=39.54 TRINITY_DN15240_c0_g1_i18:907-1701(-)